MDIIKQTQAALLLTESVRSSQEKGTTLDLIKMRSLIDNMETANILGLPMFAAIKLEKLQTVDYLNTHNINLKTLAIDYSTVASSVGWIFKELDKMSIFSDMTSSFFAVANARIENILLTFRRKLELGAKSIIIDFKDKKVIAPVSNAEINYTDGIVGLSKLATTDRTFKFKTTTDVIPLITFGEDQVFSSGSMNSMFDPSYVGLTSFEVWSKSNIATKGTFVVDLEQDDDAPTLNTITIRSENKVPTNLQVIIISEGKEIPLEQTSVVTGNVTFNFEPMLVSSVKLVLSQTLYDRIENRQYVYVFRFGNMLMENTIVSNESTVQSTVLDIGEAATTVRLRTVDSVPSNTNIDYFVSTDSVAWSKIVPTNYGSNTFNDVSIGAKKDIQIGDITSTDKPWSDLVPLTTYGNSTLFNILEQQEGKSGFLSGTTLAVATGESIDPNGIELYRGLNNYAIDIKKVQNIVHVENVLYIFTPTNGYFNAESIYTNMVSEPQVVAYNLKVKTRYLPNKTIFIRVLDADGAELTVVNQNGYNLQLRDGEVKRGQTVYITYTTTLIEIESIDNVTITVDESSFEVRMIPTAPDKGGDTIIYDPSNRLITLSPNNDYSQGSTGDGSYNLFISFQYIVESKQLIKIYSTNVKYDANTDIRIYPFTQEEIRAGNMHMIDGEVVSNLTAFSMVKGWHEVLTTQPYKSHPDNPNDVNSLSGKHSGAGLDFGNYSKMIAFKGKLKLVSTKNLANRVRKGDHRSFAFQDNKILINFVPEELPEFFEYQASHLTGEDLLCKKVIYVNDEFDRYERVDDAMELYYTIIDEDKSTTTVYVKAVLSKLPTATAKPVLQRIELALL